MELNLQWRQFKHWMIPPRQESQVMNPWIILMDQDRINWVYASGEDFSQWIGKTREEFQTQFSNQRLVFLPAHDYEQAIAQQMDQGNYLLQTQAIKTQLKLPQGSSLGTPEYGFLVSALGGKKSLLNHLLPHQYAVFFRFQDEENRIEQEIFLRFEHGKIVNFLVPDFSLLADERKQDLESAVKFLSEKYFVPVQGTLLKSKDWNQWLHSGSPWWEVATALRDRRLKIVPFRLGIIGWVLMRALWS